ncbi:MAG: hypothetical protein HZA50_06070 [Planctomycetes bacterium]|nr:hypothetical protein [Planctomycetota bacterium]
MEHERLNWAFGLLPAIVGCVLSPSYGQDAQTPRLDQCRVAYMGEAHTNFRQFADSSIWLTDGWEVYNDECKARYIKQNMPFPCRRAIYFDGKDHFSKCQFRILDLDPQGRPWFMDNRNDKQVLCWIDKEKLNRKELGGYIEFDSHVPVQPSGWPNIGLNALCDKDGTIWVANRDRIIRWKAPEETPFEISLTAPDNTAHDSQKLMGEYGWCADQLYALAGSIWLVRSSQTNSRTPGSSVIRCVPGDARHIISVSNKFVSGLVYHDGKIYMLVEADKPDCIYKLDLGQQQQLDVATITRKIAELDDETYKVRDSAQEFLKRVPLSQSKLLEDALTASTSAEQKARLEKCIKAVAEALQQSVNAMLENASAARLVFTDPEGRQYVQPYSQDGNARAELWVFDGKKCTKFAMLSAKFGLDCRGDDGLIYGRDDKSVFSIKPGGGIPQTVASLGDFADKDIKIAARHGNLLCIVVNIIKPNNWPKTLPVWFDLSSRENPPPLPGKNIYGKLQPKENEDDRISFAFGPDGYFWFLSSEQNKDLAENSRHPSWPPPAYATQLFRADGPNVETLSESLSTDCIEGIWPIGKNSAIVVPHGGGDRNESCLFYDDNRIERYASLHDLFEKRHGRLLEMVKDGEAFYTKKWYFRSAMIRLGDAFYIEEMLDIREDKYKGSRNTSGIFCDGKWLEYRRAPLNKSEDYRQITDRLAGFDARARRLVGFQDGWSSLKWIDVMSGGRKTETLAKHDSAWAWCWVNHTSLPRFTTAWTMTPEAAETFLKVEPKRKEETKERNRVPGVEDIYLSGDMPAFRSWKDGGWHVVNHTLFGGAVWEDGAGNVWHFRVREAEVFFADGSSQLIPLDCGTVEQFRLAVESPDAVWVASQQSLWRFLLVQSGSGKSWKYMPERRFRLPQIGFNFSGPWISGKNVYYASGSNLYHSLLKDLLDDKAAAADKSVLEKPASQPASRMHEINGAGS